MLQVLVRTCFHNDVILRQTMLITGLDEHKVGWRRLVPSLYKRAFLVLTTVGTVSSPV